jgi:hypothetical protein
MSFAAITLCVACQRVFVVYFVIDAARKVLDTPSCYRDGSWGNRVGSCGLDANG